MRWGDTLDDSDGEEGGVPAAAGAPAGGAARGGAAQKIEKPLPPPQVVGPDSEGVTTYLEWRRNEKGERVKSVRKIKRSMQQKRVSAKVMERRNWKLFGGAVGVRDEDMISMVSTERIVLESVKRATKEEEAAGKLDKPADGMEGLVGSNASLLVCRICGKKGDHWTSKCPYKDLAGAGGLGGGKAGDEEGSRPAGKFVAPGLRSGGNAVGESMRSRRDENSIRVNNLSEDTTERDLHDLFSPFGAVSRVYIAYDRETKESRGFAFVNFERKEEGQRAINKLDGYGFDSLILRVEWAQPREPRPEDRR